MIHEINTYQCTDFVKTWDNFKSYKSNFKFGCNCFATTCIQHFLVSWLTVRVLIRCARGNLCTLYAELLITEIFTLCVCAAGLCVRSHLFVCIYFLYVCQQKKTGCLLPYHSKISCYMYSTTFFLSKNTSSVFSYVQRAVQKEQFILFY